jgi:Flp pilus assembly protein TadG
MLLRTKKHLARFAAACGGSLMVEFALVVPVLTLLVLGLVDLGRYSLQKSALLQGAREGAQFGSYQYSDTNAINTTAQNSTGLTGVTATSSVFCECTSGVTVSCTSTCSGSAIKRYVTVTTSKSFSSMVSVPAVSLPATATASVTMICP